MVPACALGLEWTLSVWLTLRREIGSQENVCVYVAFPHKVILPCLCVC